MWFEALGKKAGDHKKNKCIVVYKPKMAELRLKDIQILPFHVLWAPDFMTVTFNRGIFVVKKANEALLFHPPLFPIEKLPSAYRSEAEKCERAKPQLEGEGNRWFFPT